MTNHEECDAIERTRGSAWIALKRYRAEEILKRLGLSRPTQDQLSEASSFIEMIDLHARMDVLRSGSLRSP